jgi:hypothetical protein
MVPLEEIRRLAVPENMSAMPPFAHSRRRSLLRRANNTAFNLVLIALVLGILGIPVAIGLKHYADSLPTVLKSTPAAQTPVATPPLASGFAGFENSLFSIAYPDIWKQSSTTRTLSTGTVARIEDFTGQTNQEVLIGTASAVPADELQQLVDAAAHLNVTVEVLQPLATSTFRTYDKQLWIEHDYTFTRVQGDTQTKMQVRALAVDLGATTFFVVAYNPQASFASANSTYFEKMLQSFRFQ